MRPSGAGRPRPGVEHEGDRVGLSAGGVWSGVGATVEEDPVAAGGVDGGPWGEVAWDGWLFDCLR
jgi:hypothetical protein